jgi:hypothetical protein
MSVIEPCRCIERAVTTWQKDIYIWPASEFMRLTEAYTSPC